MKTNKYNTIFGRTETEIEKTITRALNKIGVPIDYSKIFAVDEEGICINLTYDYVEQTKPVTRYSRAKRNGTLLLCPNCKSTKGNRVYHFSWCTILCQNCKAEVEKYDWRIAYES